MDTKTLFSGLYLVFAGMNLIQGVLEKDQTKKLNYNIAFYGLLILSYVCRL